jgi:hypothetical protein
MMLGLAIVCFHRPLADFILARDRELTEMFAQRGIRLPNLPTPSFTHNLYFAIGCGIAIFSMARIWMAL